MIESKDITAIGKFQKTHALKGELNAILDVDPSFLEEGNAVVVDIDGIFVPFYASSIRPKGNTSYLVKLDGIENEEEAKTFVNKTVYAVKSELAPFLEMEENEILDDDDLIGYSIVNSADETIIGNIVAVDSSTQNLLFIVETPDGSEIFIPAVDDFIMNVDDDHQKIVMSLPEGLINLNNKNN